MGAGGNVAGIHRFTADNVVPEEAWHGECYKCGERGHAARHCPDFSSSKIGLLGMILHEKLRFSGILYYPVQRSCYIQFYSI